MKKRNALQLAAKTTLIASAILILCALFAVAGESKIWLAFWIIMPVGLVAFVTGLVLMGKLATPDKELKARWAGYATLKPRVVEDYAAELAAVRENYAADTDPLKNTIEKAPITGAKPFYDFGVLRDGQIIYAYLVEANTALFRRNYGQRVFPAVVVYSMDEYFEAHPTELKDIADGLYENRKNNFLRDEHKFFSNVKLNTQSTERRTVYATTIMLYRYHLPFGVLAGEDMFPIIAAPKKSAAVFAVDAKYWTDNLVADYMFANASESE